MYKELFEAIWLPIVLLSNLYFSKFGTKMQKLALIIMFLIDES